MFSKQTCVYLAHSVYTSCSQTVLRAALAVREDRSGGTRQTYLGSLEIKHTNSKWMQTIF